MNATRAKHRIISFVAFLVAFVAVAARASTGLDLKKSVELALAKSPAIDTLRRELKISVLEERAASARLWPSLDFTATHGVQDSSPRASASAPWASSFDLALTETLYDNGVLLTNRKIARLNQTVTELSYRDQRDKALLEIANQFLTFSLDTKLLDIQEKQFQLVKHQYEVISKGYYSGMKTKKDYLRFKSQVSRSEIGLLNARHTLQKAKEDLIRTLGVTGERESPEFATLALENVVNDLAFSSSDVKERLRDHAETRIAEIKREIGELSADLIGRKRLPEWNLSGGVDYGNSNYLGTNQSTTDNAALGWKALLTVKYNLFDWGVRSRDAEVAIERKLIQENAQTIGLLALKASLENLASDVKRIQKTYGLAKELLALEKSNYDYIQREYQDGKAQYLDLITGLNDFSDAQGKFFAAAADLQAAKFTLLYHQGKLHDELLR